MSGVGLISGIDTATLISQLMSIERRPLNRLENAKSERESELTVLSDLRSKLTTLRSKVTGLKSVASFSKISASSSDEDIATISATGTAAVGSHTMKVSQLAQAHQSVSQGFSSFSAAIGTGTFRVSIGGEDHDITVGSSNNTLSGLRDAINNLDADVTATIVNDGGANPYRLVISSDESGTANAHTLSTIGWTGTAPVFTDGATEGVAGQQATDALFTFDGIAVTKSSNEVDDLIEGMTLFLKDASEPEKTVNISLTSNVSEVKKTINDYVSTYNEIVNYLDAKLESDDMGDSFTLRRIKTELSSIITNGNANSSGVYQRFSQFGISQAEGTLTVNSDTLDDALEDHFDDVIKVFTTQGSASDSKVAFAASSTATVAGTYNVVISGIGENLAGTIGGYGATKYSGSYLIGNSDTPVEGLMIRFDGSETGNYGSVTVGVGVMEQMERRLSGYLSHADGLIKTREETIKNAIRDYDLRIDLKEQQMSRIEQGLKTKFTRLETALSQLQSSQSALSALSSLGLF